MKLASYKTKLLGKVERFLGQSVGLDLDRLNAFKLIACCLCNLIT